MDTAKNTNSNKLLNALLIGFLMGIVLYSILKNNFGWLMLLPLFLAYKLANPSRKEDKKDSL